MAKNSQRETASREIFRGSNIAIARMGELIEKNPDAYMDESWLPLDKATMKTIFKAAIIAEKDPKQMELLKSGWVCLANFQPNIGEVPVRFPAIAEGFTPEALAPLNRFVEIGKIAADESQRLLGEVRQFMESRSDKS